MTNDKRERQTVWHPRRRNTDYPAWFFGVKVVVMGGAILWFSEDWLNNHDAVARCDAAIKNNAAAHAEYSVRIMRLERGMSRSGVTRMHARVTDAKH